MNVEIDKSLCSGCGLCVSMCPDVFEIDEDDRAYVLVSDVSLNDAADVQLAMEECPTGAIDE